MGKLFALLLILYVLAHTQQRAFGLLEQHFVSLDEERNRINYFEYILVDTRVSESWEALPNRRDNLISRGFKYDTFFDERKACKVRLQIDLLRFNTKEVVLCLYKDYWDDEIVEKMHVEIQGGKFDAKSFYTKVQPVTGYALHQEASLVTGYLIDKCFFGQVRLLDKFRNHFIAYYIEPLENAELYDSQITPASVKSNALHSTTISTAILFEYVAHTEISKRVPKHQKIKIMEEPESNTTEALTTASISATYPLHSSTVTTPEPVVHSSTQVAANPVAPVIHSSTANPRPKLIQSTVHPLPPIWAQSTTKPTTAQRLNEPHFVSTTKKREHFQSTSLRPDFKYHHLTTEHKRYRLTTVTPRPIIPVMHHTTVVKLPVHVHMSTVSTSTTEKPKGDGDGVVIHSTQVPKVPYRSSTRISTSSTTTPPRINILSSTVTSTTSTTTEPPPAPVVHSSTVTPTTTTPRPKPPPFIQSTTLTTKIPPLMHLPLPLSTDPLNNNNSNNNNNPADSPVVHSTIFPTHIKTTTTTPGAVVHSSTIKTEPAKGKPVLHSTIPGSLVSTTTPTTTTTPSPLPVHSTVIPVKPRNPSVVVHSTTIRVAAPPFAQSTVLPNDLKPLVEVVHSSTVKSAPSAVKDVLHSTVIPLKAIHEQKFVRSTTEKAKSANAPHLVHSTVVPANNLKPLVEVMHSSTMKSAPSAGGTKVLHSTIIPKVIPPRESVFKSTTVKQKPATVPTVPPFVHSTLPPAKIKAKSLTVMHSSTMKPERTTAKVLHSTVIGVIPKKKAPPEPVVGSTTIKMHREHKDIAHSSTMRPVTRTHRTIPTHWHSTTVTPKKTSPVVHSTTLKSSGVRKPLAPSPPAPAQPPPVFVHSTTPKSGGNKAAATFRSSTVKTAHAQPKKTVDVVHSTLKPVLKKASMFLKSTVAPPNKPPSRNVQHSSTIRTKPPTLRPVWQSTKVPAPAPKLPVAIQSTKSPPKAPPYEAYSTKNPGPGDWKPPTPKVPPPNLGPALPPPAEPKLFTSTKSPGAGAPPIVDDHIKFTPVPPLIPKPALKPNNELGEKHFKSTPAIPKGRRKRYLFGGNVYSTTPIPEIPVVLKPITFLPCDETPFDPECDGKLKRRMETVSRHDAGLVSFFELIKLTNQESLKQSTANKGTRSRRSLAPRVPFGQKRLAQVYFNPISNIDDEDMIEEIYYPKGPKTGPVDVYDYTRNDALLCKLCIWLQPEFADIFGFRHGPQYAVGELIDLIRYVNWIFRPIDFSMDYKPENVGFTLDQMIVSDIPEINAISDLEWLNEQAQATHKTYDILHHKFPKSCCVILAYVYKNMPPFGSLSIRRGMCVNNKNIGIISGNFHGHKVAKYDVYRSTVHALGHLMGALNDDISDIDCHDEDPLPYLNPYIMHPVHQINVGLRPNSMRMSFCARLKIAVFLGSSYTSCLESRSGPFCGNGIVEYGEECDCGSPWQCIYTHQCCGMRDSFSPCKVIDRIPGEQCVGPSIMDET